MPTASAASLATLASTSFTAIREKNRRMWRSNACCRGSRASLLIMNEAFQLALRAENLDAIRLCPKTDLHNHGWAGADPASVATILGKKYGPLEHNCPRWTRCTPGFASISEIPI